MVKARQKTLKASPDIRTGHSHDHFRARRRPNYLFSGLLKGGCCQGSYSMISKHLLGCSNARNKGTCADLQNIRREVLEDRVSKESLDQQSLKLETRRTELEALLASSKAPPPLFHPEMAGVYREQIIRLHEALNSELETQRQEAAEIVRSLIEAIILTPSDDGMRIDVRGDLAGILTIACGTQKSANAGMRSRFDPRSQFEMVAGAGFEPAAFRL